MVSLPHQLYHYTTYNQLTNTVAVIKVQGTPEVPSYPQKLLGQGTGECKPAEGLQEALYQMTLDRPFPGCQFATNAVQLKIY